ncbi:histidine kinase [Couchioplanes caeruleus subsp. azureus]|nr:histidine kinase [Couchioplanes caeruleus subsp. azureus]
MRGQVASGALMERLWRMRGPVALGALMCLCLAVVPPADGRPLWTTGLSVAAIVAGLWLSRGGPRRATGASRWSRGGRFRPLAAVLTVLAFSVLDRRLFVAVLFLAYHAGRRRPVSAGTLGGFAAVGALGGIVQSLQGSDLYTVLVWLGGAIVFGLFPVLVGSFRRLQAELVLSGWERAAQLEREQRIVAEQARLRERARIAREMHDSLGHELSLVALRAGALELAEGLGSRHRAAASELRAGVATAAERLGEIVGLLRDEADEVPLRPVGEHIEELVARALASGVPVTLDAGGDYDDVAPMQYRAAYRVVQESLTNATKHAPGGPVHVSLDRVADDIVVSVRNGASPHRAGVPLRSRPEHPPRRGHRPVGGRGLAGLRERVELAHGVLHAGPCGDGFEVEARIPAHPDPGRAPAAGPEPHAVAGGYAAGFRRADHNARRGLLLAVAVPSALVVALTGTLMLVYAHDSVTSRLAPADFHALPLGAGRDELADRLPGRQVPERRDAAGPVPLPGATCEYYRSAAGFLPAPFDVYRLCFRDGRLVAKDVLPSPGG